MIKTAGAVFDFYDDNGAFLREKLAGQKVPEAIAEAAVLAPQGLAELPDNAFAGVIINGDDTLRKFACVDKGNTMVSAMYFLENRIKLPDTARIKIASNLLAACRHFQVAPPPALAKEAAGRVLIKGDGAEMTVPRKGEKTADLTGTNVMPITAAPSIRKSKQAAVISDPYVDVTGSTVGPPRDYTVLDDSMYAMVSKDGIRSHPLQTWEQIKTAAEFFDESHKRMHPRTRRSFCEKVASRADSLGIIDIPDVIRKYGAQTYAPNSEMEMACDTRRQLWREHHDESVSLLNGLMEKRASIAPEIFAETLFQIDLLSGSDRLYDKAIPDPWASTFGLQKIAAWRWVSGNDVLTEDELKNFATSSRQLLNEHFGEDLAKGLGNNPVSVFESLPLPQQRVIARLAHQQGDGGAAAQINRA